jgi:hydrogenase maturation protease
MNDALLHRIVNAVLYEGCILYPYRPSVKNSQRWTFGGLYPRSFCEAQSGTDAWTAQTECLIEGSENAELEVRVRFLHLLARFVGRLHSPAKHISEVTQSDYRVVEKLRIGDRLLHTWQEVIEREHGPGYMELGSLVREPRCSSFAFRTSRMLEPVCGPMGDIEAVLVREQEMVAGQVEVSAQPAAEGLFKLRVRVENLSGLEDPVDCSRGEALMRTLVSTHTVLGAKGGAFVSLLDPPEERRAIADSCRNVGTWPVLVGEEGEKDTMLSAPIILYDYPQIAPESPGDLCDSTEIDELLTLRILTLTDEEKELAAAVDARARSILQRTASLTDEQVRQLHGAIRDLRPVTSETAND